LRFVGDAGQDRLYIDHMYVRSLSASPSGATAATLDSPIQTEAMASKPEAATAVPAGETDHTNTHAQANAGTSPDHPVDAPLEHVSDVEIEATDGADNVGVPSIPATAIIQLRPLSNRHMEEHVSMMPGLTDPITMLRAQAYAQAKGSQPGKPPVLPHDADGLVQRAHQRVATSKPPEPKMGQPDGTMGIQASHSAHANSHESSRSAELAALTGQPQPPIPEPPVVPEQRSAGSGIVFATERPGLEIEHPTVYVKED
jgi:hypothetical protein